MYSQFLPNTPWCVAPIIRPLRKSCRDYKPRTPNDFHRPLRQNLPSFWRFTPHVFSFIGARQKFRGHRPPSSKDGSSERRAGTAGTIAAPNVCSTAATVHASTLMRICAAKSVFRSIDESTGAGQNHDRGLAHSRNRSNHRQGYSPAVGKRAAAGTNPRGRA